MIHIPRSVRGFLFAAATAVALGVGISSADASGSTLKFGFGGEAFGTTVRVGNTVTSGPTFRASLGSCTATPGTTAHNYGLSTNVPNVASTGTIDNTVAAKQGSSSGSTPAISYIQNVNVASGLIKASAIKAVSRVSYTVGSGFAFENNSSFVGLTINGQSVNVTTPNTKITLAGLGYVVLNETSRTQGTSGARQTVNMIHLHVNQNNVLGIAIGTDVIVGHAIASISSPLGAGGPVTGSAYGSTFFVGNTVKSGKSAYVGVPCLGGSAHNEILSLNVSGALSTGDIYDTATATLKPTYASGETTSTVQKVNLLNGLLKADVIKADAHGTFDGSTHTLSSSGSAFTNVSVNGQKLTNVSANTQITINNVGTLYLYRVIKSAKSIEVRMVELVVTKAGNPFGLDVGSDIRIAVAALGFRD